MSWDGRVEMGGGHGGVKGIVVWRRRVELEGGETIVLDG